MLTSETINIFIAIASFFGVLIVFFQNRGVRLKKLDDMEEIEKKTIDKFEKIEEKILSIAKLTDETIKDQSILNSNLKKIELLMEKMTDVIHNSQIKQAVTDQKLDSIFEAIAEYANRVSKK